ncbi:DMT family transporter [Caloramator sp. E03]|uniref:DMT family transporter n=1 Tax=Caloramator sp. E03 TaxID=2576307 RepID=UPI00110FFF27|nr:DMT family transporter [Caloramator sp. E03]QCX33931.1 DMT family transporter [Caloramator sp. E03]
MDKKRVRSNFLLLLAATIWGFAFVAQRIGSQYVGALTFNGIRFGLGCISLIPLILYYNKKNNADTLLVDRKSIIPGIIVGTVLYIAVTLQQVGIIYTTAGKASFITGLYMVIVPIIGVILKQKIEINSWIGVGFATIGLYLLCINENFNINYGDLLIIISAFLWAIHILIIDYFLKKVEPLKLSFLQFAVCSIFSIITAAIFEDITIKGISNAIVPILYGGILSVGVAYTLQVVAQKYAKPSHAVIILSMESVMGALGGVLILGERMSNRGYIGCLLIFIAILISQIKLSPKQ